MNGNYSYKNYELVVGYNDESGLWEGTCSKLNLKMTDFSRGVLCSQFRMRVLKELKRGN